MLSIASTIHNSFGQQDQVDSPVRRIDWLSEPSTERDNHLSFYFALMSTLLKHETHGGVAASI